MDSSLLLIPGLAANEVMWRAQLAGLAELRPRVTDVHTRHASIPAMAAALLAEHEGPLVLCGASMGGMIAMEAAHQAPERIAGLALLGTNASPETEQMRVLRENAIELFAQGRVAEIIEPNVDLAFHPDHAQALREDYLRFVLDAGAEQLIRQNRAVIGRPDARLHLAQLRCPVLVLCGEDDQLAPAQHSREIAELCTQSRLVMVPRCGHMLTMEQPNVVNVQLREWLQSLPSRARGCAPSR
jgi:pimeloyl-ACP methyl ester carboxylesterase